MLLFELYDAVKAGYQNIESDNTALEWKDLRKSEVTLKHLRHLNEMLKVRAWEHAQEMKQIQDQYGPKAEAGPPGM